MKLILVADVSANGKLLLTDNPNHPVPKATVDFYIQKINQAGNLIIGSKTLEAFQQHFGGIQQIFPGIEVVVLSRSGNEANGWKVVHSPEEAVSHLQGKGFEEIVVGGGVQIYNLFLNRDMLTDIYFNYVPVIVGDGGTLGTATDLLAHQSGYAFTFNSEWQAATFVNLYWQNGPVTNAREQMFSCSASRTINVSDSSSFKVSLGMGIRPADALMPMVSFHYGKSQFMIYFELNSPGVASKNYNRKALDVSYNLNF